MSLTFERPEWLAAALIALPMAWLGLRSFVSMTRLRAWSAVVVRALLMLMLAAMLAGASMVRTSDRVGVIAVVDVSDSMRLFADRFANLPNDPDGKRESYPGAVRQWLEHASAPPRTLGAGNGRRPDDALGIVVFDGSAAAVAVPQVASSASSKGPAHLDTTFDVSMTQGTDIAGALRYARSMFPPGASRRLLLVSDGNQTTGNAEEAARELAGDGVRVDVLPISYVVDREVMIEGVDAPPQAPDGATVRVRVVIRSTGNASGTLELLYEGAPVDLNGDQPGTARHITLPPGGGRTVETLEVPLKPGIALHRFEPVFTPDSADMDGVASNNRADAFTLTPSRGRVLLVVGASESQPANRPTLDLPDTLARQGVAVSRVTPGELGNDLLSLSGYDLVMLQNVAAEELPRPTQTAIAQYVTKLGGGLVMIGGPDSFGAGGWQGTPIEPILPVRLDLGEDLIAPAAALALVLDRSGSMAWHMGSGIRSKQEVANEGAALAILTLDKSDELVVIAFDEEPAVIVPFGRNSDPLRSAQRIRSITPNGGTRIGPAMLDAAREMRSSRAAVRHMIVMTDGRDEAGSNLKEIARELHAQGITISTIGIGDDTDEEGLRAVAEIGGGKYYPVNDPNILPRVFLKEVRVVRRPLIREQPFLPHLTPSGSPLTQGLQQIPELNGLVITRARTDPKTTNAMLSNKGEPVLAHWYAGRGQVAAFTPDADHWAEPWLTWPGYAQLWGRIARTIARPAADSASELTVGVEDDELRIRLDAADKDGRALDLLSVPGTIYQPDGASSEIRLSQTGPGVYEARVPARQRGTYIAALSPMQGEKRLAPVIGGASAPIGPELRRPRSDVALLERIARITHGRVLDLQSPDTAGLFDRAGVEVRRAALPIWRTLLAWAVLLLVLDIGTRRVAWDRLLDHEWRLAMRQHAADVVKARGERAVATLEALKRVTTTDAAPAAQTPGAASRPAPVLNPGPPAPNEPEFTSDQEAAEAARRMEAQLTRSRQARERLLRGKAADGPPGAPQDPSGTQPADEQGSTADLLKARLRARSKFDPPGSENS